MKRAPRSVRSIIDQQVHRWTAQQREREEATESDQDHWPIVTVSREFGSLGAKIGSLAAQRLGFTFWDQELVATIAEQTGAQEALLQSVDETARNRIEDFVEGLVFGTSGAEADYVRQVARVVQTLDRKGGAVVVGRGGQFIVDAERALRLRVVCPHQVRVAGYAEREELTEREAEQAVDSVERDRRTFIRQHYDRDITDPSNYDLVLNSATLSESAAADVVIAAYRAKFGRVPPQTS